MKLRKIVIYTLVIILHVSVLGGAVNGIKSLSFQVSASSDDMGGQVIDNPWGGLIPKTTKAPETTTAEATTVIETTTEEPTTYAPGYYDVSEYKSGDTYTYPTKENYTFAGWYTDENCETVYEGTTGVAYARFIDKNVLKVMFQVANNKTAIRFLSTIDHMDYQAVGFIFSGTYGTKTISEKTKPVTSLFTSLVAANQKVAPTVFCNDSEYFFTYTVRKLDPETSSTWSVTPYFVTPDGTKVIGITNTYPKQ